MQKFFALCSFDCGFISCQKGEEISVENFSKMKQTLPPEALLQFVEIQTAPMPQATKKTKKETVK